eukprot:scaffold26294_cov30-Tisochrysis_lutea.AAC.3
MAVVVTTAAAAAMDMIVAAVVIVVLTAATVTMTMHMTRHAAAFCAVLGSGILRPRPGCEDTPGHRLATDKDLRTIDNAADPLALEDHKVVHMLRLHLKGLGEVEEGRGDRVLRKGLHRSRQLRRRRRKASVVKWGWWRRATRMSSVRRARCGTRGRLLCRTPKAR